MINFFKIVYRRASASEMRETTGPGFELESQHSKHLALSGPGYAGKN